VEALTTHRNLCTFSGNLKKFLRAETMRLSVDFGGVKIEAALLDSRGEIRA
jgi:hypothetical protein